VAPGRYGREEKDIQGFDVNIWRRKATWKTQVGWKNNIKCSLNIGVWAELYRQ
jgi:hypothetical protein